MFSVDKYSSMARISHLLISEVIDSTSPWYRKNPLSIKVRSAKMSSSELLAKMQRRQKSKRPAVKQTFTTSSHLFRKGMKQIAVQKVFSCQEVRSSGLQSREH